MNSEPVNPSVSAAMVLHASKWLQHPVLLEVEEMRALLTELGQFGIYNTDRISLLGDEKMPPEEFLEAYTYYVGELKAGRLPEDRYYRLAFSAALSASDQVFHVRPVEGGRQLLKAVRPVVQMQPHTFDYFPADNKFRSMVFGKQAVVWGIQFSYPQVYQDPYTRAFIDVAKSREPNTELFRRLQLWLRRETLATPFLLGGERRNAPIRIGRQVLPWIARHPQLAAKGMGVLPPSE